jgi:hypothetical protein
LRRTLSTMVCTPTTKSWLWSRLSPIISHWPLLNFTVTFIGQPVHHWSLPFFC